MIYGNALRDLFMRMGRNPWQQYQMPVEPQQMSGPGMPQIPFQPMPFEGGMPSRGKGQTPFGVPNMGMNVPRNALMGMRGFGMRQRY